MSELNLCSRAPITKRELRSPRDHQTTKVTCRVTALKSCSDIVGEQRITQYTSIILLLFHCRGSDLYQYDSKFLESVRVSDARQLAEQRRSPAVATVAIRLGRDRLGLTYAGLEEARAPN